jgi:DNA polymerase I
MAQDLRALLANIKEKETQPAEQESKNFHSRVLLIDGLNLFFRNFATINFLNREGVPIGGMAGFLRSLGSLIHLVQPTGVYVIFDGQGSTTNRKNLLPEYKSNRGITRITNWDTYDNIEEEGESKVDQITRLTHYLPCLPIKTGMIDKAEADDMIAYLATKLSQERDSDIIIVSSDKDYLQLANPKITVYRPISKKFYKAKEVAQEYGIHSDNFIIYKTLLGDKSDKIQGIRGLGPKTLLKHFPELIHHSLDLDEIFEIAEAKLTTHKVFAKILHEQDNLRNSYRLMDLKNPILDDRQIKYIESLVEETNNPFYRKEFLEMYEQDGVAHFIKNVESWVTDTFFKLGTYK